MIDAVMPGLHIAWWEEVHLLLFGELGSGRGGSGKVERLAFPILVPPVNRCRSWWRQRIVRRDPSRQGDGFRRGSFSSVLPGYLAATSVSPFAATANASRQQDRPA